MFKKLKNGFKQGVALGATSKLISEQYKKNGLSGALKASVVLAGANVNAMAADDEVFQPIVDLLQVWLQGNLGYVIALFVVAAGIIYGALGGGAPIAFKAVFFGLLIGAITYVADKAFNLGLNFS